MRMKTMHSELLSPYQPPHDQQSSKRSKAKRLEPFHDILRTYDGKPTLHLNKRGVEWVRGIARSESDMRDPEQRQAAMTLLKDSTLSGKIIGGLKDTARISTPGLVMAYVASPLIDRLYSQNIDRVPIKLLAAVGTILLTFASYMVGEWLKAKNILAALETLEPLLPKKPDEGKDAGQPCQLR
jgi:hypothetical protein